MKKSGRSNSFSSVGQALSHARNPVLAEAASRCRALTPLNTAWRRAVAADVYRHTRAVDLRGGAMTVHADSPVWANLLRHSERSIVDALQASGMPEARALRIRVAPPQAPPDPGAAEDSAPLDPKFRRLFAQLRKALD